MSIDELIAELQRQREIIIEDGFDPSQTEVLIPAVERTKLTVWESVVDTEIIKHDRGTRRDLQLQGLK